MNRQSGLTLAELLVVVAILAVLAALLFPVFTTARHASKASVCASNLRQLSKATLLYTQDYDECFPLAFYRMARASGACLRTVMGAAAALPARLPRRAVPCRSCEPIDLTAMRSRARGVGLPALC
jgi:prepilin-type N-terminal cleavage/methylation domain-containing protein